MRALSKLVERLSLRFPHVPRETIESAVQEEHHTFDGRPVRAYVPILVERKAKTRLRTLAEDTHTHGWVEPAPFEAGHLEAGLPQIAGDPTQPKA